MMEDRFKLYRNDQPVAIVGKNFRTVPHLMFILKDIGFDFLKADLDCWMKSDLMACAELATRTVLNPKETGMAEAFWVAYVDFVDAEVKKIQMKDRTKDEESGAMCRYHPKTVYIFATPKGTTATYTIRQESVEVQEELE